MKLPPLVAQMGRHEKDIRNHFKNRMTFRGSAPEFAGPLVLVGFFNRTGSTLLANYLRGLDHASGFKEYLNGGLVIKRSERYGLKSFPDYFRHGESRNQAAGHMHGYKAGWNQIHMLLRCGIDRMYEDGIRVVHISRRDVVAQAVSLSIARQTAQWTSEHTGREGVEPEYDANQLSHLIQSCYDAENRIRMLSQMFGLPYHPVVYEDLVDNPQQVMAGVGTFLGRDLSAWEPAEVALKRQASARNAEWKERYISEAREVLRRPGRGGGKKNNAKDTAD